MWQKRLRLAIALLVVVFAAMVVVSLRHGHKRRATSATVLRSDPKATIENRGGGVYERSSEGKTTFSLKFGRSLTYSDGRTKLWGVRLLLPDKAGRRVTITSAEATVLNPPDKGFARAEFFRGVKLDDERRGHHYVGRGDLRSAGRNRARTRGRSNSRKDG